MMLSGMFVLCVIVCVFVFFVFVGLMCSCVLFDMYCVVLFGVLMLGVLCCVCVYSCVCV